MTNERYKLMVGAYLAAKRELGCCLLYFISPSTFGKSDTTKILLKNYSNSKKIQPSTNSALYEDVLRDITMHNIKMFIIDDRSLWLAKDFSEAIGTLKLLSEGKLQPLRKTKFGMEITEMPVTASALLNLNVIQSSAAFPRLAETGFIDRAIKVRFMHTNAEYCRILDEYDTHGWKSEGTLPSFFIEDGFFKEESDPQTVDSDNKLWINERFKSASRKGVMLLAKVTSKAGFESLKPVLEKSVQDTEFYEYIKFKNGNNDSNPLLEAGDNN